MVDIARSRIPGFTPLQAKLIARGFVGEVKNGFWTSSDVPDGWLALDGSSIGNSSSSATGRANNDTRELFDLLWANATDSECAMQTSAGGASTRGASADADWTANKRLVLVDSRGKHPLSQAASGTGNTLADTGGAIDHTHNNPAHYHSTGTLGINASGSHPHQIQRSSAQANSGGSGGMYAIQANTGTEYDYTQSATHVHLNSDFAGNVGNTAGSDGDTAVTSTTGNSPFYVVYSIIAY